jgi:hypothetical protein
MKRLLGWAALLAATLPAAAGAAAIETRTYLIAIGNNQPRAGAAGGGAFDPGERPLRYADDDAAAFYELLSAIAADRHLLTSMDRDTQVLYPRLVDAARQPTLEELRQTIASVARNIAQDHLAGRRSVLFFFYSGHGSTGDGRGGPELRLQEGGISQAFLYDELLARLPADHVHIFIDACHAEAVVRPRDAEAREVALAPPDANAILARATLARFPNVGAILAASTSAQAHEWDLLGHGVFTYELLSALRGASDVNRDGRIEYSEVFAFLTAANRGVADPRAHLEVVARVPEVDRRVPLLDLRRLPAAGTARLTGISTPAGLVKIEDAAGRGIASVRPEVGFVADVVVPAGGTIYVRAGAREARFEARPGQILGFDELAFDAPSARARGALADAMSRGLFATAFGRGYYMGFIDQAADFIPVPFDADADPAAQTPAPSTPAVSRVAQPTRPAAAGAGGGVRAGVNLLVGLGAARAVARDFDFSQSVRVGIRPRASSGAALSLDLDRAASAGMAEWQAIATAGWVGARHLGPLRGWLGAVAGGGLVAQTLTGASLGISGALVAGPTTGLLVELPRRFGVWVEGQWLGMAYRRNDRTAIAAAPAAWMGLTLGL